MTLKSNNFKKSSIILTIIITCTIAGSMILINKGREVLLSEYEKKQYSTAQKLSGIVAKNLADQVYSIINKELIDAKIV